MRATGAAARMDLLRMEELIVLGLIAVSSGQSACNGTQVRAPSLAAVRASNSLRSKPEFEAPGHWTVGRVAARRDGEAALGVDGRRSLRRGKFQAFRSARADRWRVRIREGNVAKACSLRNRMLDCLHFRRVRLGGVRRGLLRPGVPQGDHASQSGDRRQAAHIHTLSADVLTANLPNRMPPRKTSSLAAPFAPSGKVGLTAAPRVAALLAAHGARVDLRPHPCAPPGFHEP
jgi:hypothetical protein